MTTAHTQSRITFKEDGDANHFSMLTEDGRWLLALLHNGEQVSPTKIANFRRLAACWNACETIPTEKLEGMLNTFAQYISDIGGIAAGQAEQIECLKDQRAELLKALEQAATKKEAP